MSNRDGMTLRSVTDAGRLEHGPTVLRLAKRLCSNIGTDPNALEEITRLIETAKRKGKNAFSLDGLIQNVIERAERRMHASSGERIWDAHTSSFIDVEHRWAENISGFVNAVDKSGLGSLLPRDYPRDTLEILRSR